MTENMIEKENNNNERKIKNIRNHLRYRQELTNVDIYKQKIKNQRQIFIPLRYHKMNTSTEQKYSNKCQASLFLKSENLKLQSLPNFIGIKLPPNIKQVVFFFNIMQSLQTQKYVDVLVAQSGVHLSKSRVSARLENKHLKSSLLLEF